MSSRRLFEAELDERDRKWGNRLASAVVVVVAALFVVFAMIDAAESPRRMMAYLGGDRYECRAVLVPDTKTGNHRYRPCDEFKKSLKWSMVAPDWKPPEEFR